ncbi:rhomboid family intramembrane serine protease [Halioxenophilus sp. WMMB6]|uniref:rhomboid family intramembrane serine protease n=1 Tax=Halioxenophilus sp. WMMB6 TaxID=3073815 RepID=UPI00295E7CF3|nr:rhomboid family intramembrane serine protease [Halioxenophilus sp. WMMB6]
MLFFPYRVELPYRQQLELKGAPFFSLLFGVLCFLVFALQLYSDKQYEKGIVNYCQYELTEGVIPVFKKIRSDDVFSVCTNFLADWDINYDNKSLEYFAFKAQLSPEEEAVLKAELMRFNSIVSYDPLTVEFWHDPLDSDITQYISSSFLHADWEHLLFNLIFFFAFSITIEKLIGSLAYLFFFLLCCFSTGIAYESNIFGEHGGLPTLGLSGVVMGLMALTACIYPLKKMAVFVWILLFITTIRIPVFILVGFYVLTDVYGMAYLMDEGDVNYVAHVAGAITGIAFSILFHTYKYLFPNKNNPIDLGGKENA